MEHEDASEGRIINRSYAEPAEGWVDGVYRGRVAHDEPIGPADFAHGPVAFTFSALREDRAPMDGDPASVGTFTYYSGTTLVAPMPSRNYRVTLDVANPEPTDLRLRPVVNELAHYDAFDVPAGARTTVSFTAILSKRLMELTFTPASEPTAHPELHTLLVHRITVEETAPEESEPAPERRIFVIADSICQTYFDNERPQSGWGEQLFRTLFPGGVAVIERDRGGSAEQSRVMRSANGTLEIHNRALGARSARSYIGEGRLNEVLRDVRPGDWLLLQMGPNDATRLRPMRYADPPTYAAFLDRYVTSARDRGVTPMLVTPSCTCDFAADDTLMHRFADYRDAMLAYARDHDVPVADLGAYGLELERRLGPLRSHALHMKLDAGQYANYPDGVDDNVHLNLLGAAKSARFVADEFLRAFPDSGFGGGDEAPGSAAGKEVLGPAGVSGLTAQIEDAPGAQAVKLRWKASPDAEYYTVARHYTVTRRELPGAAASGSMASGSSVFDSTASGSTASGSTASGSTASGSTASGSTASGSTAPSSAVSDFDAPGSAAPGSATAGTTALNPAAAAPATAAPVALETVTLNPWYYDRPSPDWPERVDYEITAWREDHPSPAARITVRHRFDATAEADRHIGGLNVYEVDRATFPGQIAFSVRFRARPDADRYTVVLLGPNGMRRDLDRIPDAQVNGLHSYRVDDAPGLSILIEAGNAAGDRFASDPVPLG
ncbi:GDSL-type esterase/lipase family protein [Bifidobacterium avesanii]|uniref:GDSL-type esterase/lipase family protein n=1 Tax=Bifidobacterium avesanii TaxID=1798157 RepID=UPI00138104E3|nr:GDSL-type esterase/lipase family protein [Bifidobacterium avesanii]KAB8290330.1 rhamnogalacturonan acetylesterase [Bifidobacterium avesanii]